MRKGYTYSRIERVLRCSPSFISRWKNRVKRKGLEGLRPLHRGRSRIIRGALQRHVERLIDERWIDGERLLTLGNVAELVGVDRKTVVRYIDRKEREAADIHYGGIASMYIRDARTCYLDLVGFFLSRRQRIVAFANRGARRDAYLESFPGCSGARILRERDPESTWFSGLSAFLDGAPFRVRDIRREKLYGAMVEFIRTVDQRFPQLAVVIADNDSLPRRRHMWWAFHFEMRTAINFVSEGDADRSWAGWVNEVLSWIEADMTNLRRNPPQGRLARRVTQRLRAVRNVPGFASVWVHRDSLPRGPRTRRLWYISRARHVAFDS